MVIQAFRPILGGAQRQVERLAPALAARGADVHVVTRRVPGTPRRELAPGLTIHRTPGPATGPAGSAAYTALGALTTAVLRPDVIHVHDVLSPGTIGLLASLPTGTPVVAKILSTGRGGDLDRLGRKPLAARRLAWMRRRFAAFICLSGDVEAELLAAGVPAERMRRIPNAVDGDAFRPAGAGERAAARERLGVGPDEPLAVYCGRMYDSKRLDVLLRAAAAAPVRVLIAGEGPAEPSLRALATELGLGDRVRMLPAMPDVRDLYRAADLYVSTSEAEGMSGSVMEAMASGLAVVAAPASGMEELLSGGAGVRLGTHDPAELAAALERLAADAEERARLGAAARERVLADLTLDAVADRLTALYAEVRATRS
jgi:glycosyltransferase involved in cell wall biosynthesis